MAGLGEYTLGEETMSKLSNVTGAALLAAALTASAASAREPGVLPTIPPGASMGVPIAAPSPFDGVFLSSRTGLSFQSFHDDDGTETPTELTITDTVLQFAIVPGNTVLGGQYRAFFTLPFIHVDAENVATPFGLVDDKNSGIGSIEIRPVDLSWQTAPGIFVNAGLSIHTPTGWSATDLVNPGQNFWSVAPSLGVSYLRDGWNASAHLLYFANFANKDNDYESGDEVHLNLTAMKDIGNNWSIGGVGYLRQQISDDKNPGGAYGGLVSGKAEQRGLGLSVTKQAGPININAMYTKEFSTRNSGGGDRLWLNAIIPLQIKGR